MMFRPRDGYDQKVLDETLTILPKPAQIRWLHDVFGNFVAVASFDARAEELSFASNIRLEHTPTNLPDLQIEPEATAYPFSYSEDELPDLLPFMTRRYPDPDNAVERWVRRFLRQGRSNETGRLDKPNGSTSRITRARSARRDEPKILHQRDVLKVLQDLRGEWY